MRLDWIVFKELVCSQIIRELYLNPSVELTNNLSIGVHLNLHGPNESGFLGQFGIHIFILYFHVDFGFYFYDKNE